MSATHKRVRVVHASLRVFDNDKQVTHDLRVLSNLGANVIMGTESGDAGRRALIHEFFEGRGYQPYTPFGTDSWIAARGKFVRPGFLCKMREVIPSGGSSGDPHHYAAKGVVSMEWDHPALGHVGFAVTHALTQGRRPGQEQEDKPGDPVDHYAQNTKLMHALAERGNEMSQGDGLAWLSADTNMRDQQVDVFRGAPGGWQTCWDELDVHPPTLAGSTTTMDMIATKRSDERIQLLSARALSDKTLFLHTDHHVVVADYRVKKITRKA